MLRFSTAMLSTLLVVGCSSGDGDNGPPTDPRELTLIDPAVADVGLAPVHSQRLTVRYQRADGTPIAGWNVTFAIVGAAKGSTLSADTVETDRDGVATVWLHAGSAETSFSVRVSALNAQPKVLYIEIGAVGFGALYASTALPTLTAEREVVVLDHLLYDGMGCAERPPHAPPEAARNLSDSDPAAPVRFGALRVGQSRGLLVLGFDAKGRLLAAGCVDLPADLIRKGSTVQLEVTLADLPPRVMGHYELDTDLLLDSTAGPMATALAPWSGIIDCPRDPAQRLLDCAFDALDDGDPLDCETEQSSASTKQLAQSRGAVESDGCRSELTTASEKSLEAVLTATMQANDTDGALEALALIHPRATALISHLRLRTRLSLSDPATVALQSPLSASHRVLQISFVDPAKSAVTYEANRAALPVPLSTGIAASLAGWRLEIGRHELGIRFALMARQALTDGVLTPAQLPGDPEALVQLIASLVTSPGKDPGCPALSAIVCSQGGQKEDCLLAACEAGLTALATELVEGFTALDSAAADLSLAGAAQLVDETGDLHPDALTGEGSKPAVWSEAKLVLGTQLAEINALQATFTGEPATE